MILVVDASIAIKWFVEEERRHFARRLLGEDVTRAAPALILTEVANALRKKVASNEVTADQARAALAALPDCFSNLIASEAILATAFEMSLELNHFLGDCVYLACAQLVGGQMITDDRKFLERVSATKYSGLIVGLEAWAATAGLPSLIP